MDGSNRCSADLHIARVSFLNGTLTVPQGSPPTFFISGAHDASALIANLWTLDLVAGREQHMQRRPEERNLKFSGAKDALNNSA